MSTATEEYSGDVLNSFFRGLSPEARAKPPVPDGTDGAARPPDWKTNSDAAFLQAAQAVFAKNAALLRRLA